MESPVLETSEQDLGTSDPREIMCGARMKRCSVTTHRGAGKIHPVCLIPILADYESADYESADHESADHKSADHQSADHKSAD
jgi:hypothetical protein